jgi:hypothetical protein
LQQRQPADDIGVVGTLAADRGCPNLVANRLDGAEEIRCEGAKASDLVVLADMIW